MSIEMMSTLVAAAASSKVVKDAAKQALDLVREKYGEKGVVVTADPQDYSDVDAIKNTIGRTLPEAEERTITISALNQAHGSTMALREERMRQAKTAFNAAIALLVTGILIIFAGVIFMLVKENPTGGAITTSVGAIVEVVSALLFRFNTEANNRLDEIAKYLNRIEGAQLALNLASKIENRQKRDDAIRDAAIALSSAKI